MLNLIIMPTSPQFQIKLIHGHAFILRSVYTRNLTLFRRAFITFARPILECASQLWNPFTHKSVIDIEHAQRHFTSRISSLKHLSYPNGFPFST